MSDAIGKVERLHDLRLAAFRAGAIAIIEAISVDFEITPRAALQPNIEQVKTWRTSPWDSLERT